MNDDMDASAATDTASASWISFRQRLDMTVEHASPRIEEFTGIPAQHWQNDPMLFWQVVHEADAPGLRQHLEASPDAVKETSLRLRHRSSGRVAYVWEIRRPLITDSGELDGFECVWLDMTRRTLAEARMSTSAWNEALGSLTLGLTHEFNNLLAGILSLSDFQLSQVDTDDPMHETLSLIKGNCHKACSLVGTLHELHRTKPADHNFIDLNTVTKDTLDVLRHALPRRVQIETDFASGVMPLHSDLSELRQAIVHIARNAADALTTPGSILFRTSSHPNAPSAENSHGPMPNGPCLCLTIQDDGPGINPHHLADIFSPYYTTKSSNNGTGLGLFQAGRCIANNQGAITAASDKNGTVIQIWLPQADLSDPPPTVSPLERHGPTTN